MAICLSHLILLFSKARLVSCKKNMIFSDKKIVVQRVKGGSFRFVTVQDFNIVRIDVVSALIIPPHHYMSCQKILTSGHSQSM